MMNCQIDPDEDSSDKIFPDWEEEEPYDDDEEFDIAEYNYECRLFREPEKQIFWNRKNVSTNNNRRFRIAS